MPPPRVCVPDPRMHIWPVCVSHECRSPRSVGGGWVWVWVGGCAAQTTGNPLLPPKQAFLPPPSGTSNAARFPAGAVDLPAAIGSLAAGGSATATALLPPHPIVDAPVVQWC